MVRPRGIAVGVGAFLTFWSIGLASQDAAGDTEMNREAEGDGTGIDLSRFGSLSLFGPNGGGEEAPKPEEPRPVAGYDSKLGGFFLQSPDGKFLLRFNARIQARYTYFGKDTTTDDEVGRDESYFELERARIGFSGHLFDPKIKYKVEFDADTDAGDKGSLTDAFVLYEHCQELAFGVGQFKPAFLRQEYISSAKQQRVERSLSNEFFNIDRNIGVWAEGDLVNLIYYNVAITNGIDTVNVAPGGGSSGGQVLDQLPAYVAKLDLVLAGDRKYSYEESDLKNLEKPLFVMGGSFVQESYNGTQQATSFINTEGDVYSFGIDGIFKYRGFSLQGEYVGRWYDQNSTTAGTTDFPRTDALYSHGFNVQGGIFISRSPDIELNGRFSAILGNEGPKDGNGYEAGPGINWFFSRSQNGKVQLDVAWVDIDDDVPAQTENLRLGPSQSFSTSSAGFSAGEQGILTRVQVQLTF